MKTGYLQFDKMDICQIRKIQLEHIDHELKLTNGKLIFQNTKSCFQS